MKKLLMTAAALSALAASPAMAATTANYDVTGTVAAACSISASGTLAFGSLASGATNTTLTTQSSTDAAAFCNQAATTVTVAHTNMTTGASAPTGFTNTVAFTPRIATQATTLTGDQTAGTALGAFNTLTVSAIPTQPTANLVAGSYSGSITITLAPNS
jgi:hypothetical protein